MKRTKPTQEATGRERQPGSIRTFTRAKRPVVGFVVLFAVLMGVFYGITFVPAVSKRIIPAYMRLNAKISVAVLNLFGEGAKARGTSVSSSRYSVDIRHGCDAVEPTALFVAAVLAFPAALRFKLSGALVGILVLAAINLVRIVSLFYTGIYRPTWFEIMHVDVWQPVFILLALTLWVIWAWWATRDAQAPTLASNQRAKQSHAPDQTD